jgi:hypothetical protein
MPIYFFLHSPSIFSLLLTPTPTASEFRSPSSGSGGARAGGLPRAGWWWARDLVGSTMSSHTRAAAGAPRGSIGDPTRRHAVPQYRRLPRQRTPPLPVAILVWWAISFWCSCNQYIFRVAIESNRSCNLHIHFIIELFFIETQPTHSYVL